MDTDITLVVLTVQSARSLKVTGRPKAAELENRKELIQARKYGKWKYGRGFPSFLSTARPDQERPALAPARLPAVPCRRGARDTQRAAAGIPQVRLHAHGAPLRRVSDESSDPGLQFATSAPSRLGRARPPPRTTANTEQLPPGRPGLGFRPTDSVVSRLNLGTRKPMDMASKGLFWKG